MHNFRNFKEIPSNFDPIYPGSIRSPTLPLASLSIGWIEWGLTINSNLILISSRLQWSYLQVNTAHIKRLLLLVQIRWERGDYYPLSLSMSISCEVQIYVKCLVLQNSSAWQSFYPLMSRIYHILSKFRAGFPSNGSYAFNMQSLKSLQSNRYCVGLLDSKTKYEKKYVVGDFLLAIFWQILWKQMKFAMKKYRSRR